VETGEMKLERRHFKFLADTLKDCKPLGTEHDMEVIQWRVTVRDFAAACYRTNTNFNRERFLTACGYDA
jgi:hypothetical protein